MPNVQVPMETTIEGCLEIVNDSKLGGGAGAVNGVVAEWTSVPATSYWTVFLLGTMKKIPPAPEAKATSLSTPPVSIPVAVPVAQLCVFFTHSIGVTSRDRASETMKPVIESIVRFANKRFYSYQWEYSFGMGNGLCNPLWCSHIHPTRFRVQVEQFDLPIPLRKTFDIELPQDHSVGSPAFLWKVDLEMKTSWLSYVIRDVSVLNSQFD